MFGRFLATGAYSGFNHSHLTEMLADREGIHLSLHRPAGPFGRGNRKPPSPSKGALPPLLQLEGRGIDSHRRRVPFALFRWADAQGDHRSPRQRPCTATGIAYSRTAEVWKSNSGEGVTPRSSPGRWRNWALGSSWPIHRRPLTFQAVSPQSARLPAQRLVILASTSPQMASGPVRVGLKFDGPLS